ncbi:TPR and ankyrin repeat-containing protein 1 isoform X2 [Hyperolius riggenbachi]|uniref:TPR and ankyrin repeat-containing protein 1 isoform X2 n=1 Tax=Hyperolius riggenbachi TaxID=752182 RepID=UPI0035A30F20
MNRMNDPSLSDYLSYAHMLKCNGNSLFKAGHYLKALEKYHQAIGVMSEILLFGDFCKDMAVLWNNCANALYKLEKFGEAYVSAQNSIGFDPHFAKAYFRAGHSLLMLGDLYASLNLFFNGLMKLHGSSDSRDIVDFLHGIFKTYEVGENSSNFREIFGRILREQYSGEVWKMLLAKLIKDHMNEACVLLMKSKSKLPDIKDLNKVSMADIFETYADPSFYGDMSLVAELVTWFINMGANVETIGDHPLHSILKLCFKSDNSLFKRVMSIKPAMKRYINDRDKDGNTVLHLVASTRNYSRGYTLNRQTQDIKMLLGYGADPSIVDKHKKDVAALLKQNKNFKAEDVIKKHLAKDSPPVVQSSEGCNAPDGERSSFACVLESFVNFCKQTKELNIFQHQPVMSFLCELSSLKEIPSEMTCDIPDSISEQILTQLIQQQKWKEVLLLLTRNTSGEISHKGLIECSSLPKVDIHHVIHCLGPKLASQLPLIKILLERGVSPNGIGATYEHPICTCLKNSEFSLAYLLLRSGGDPRGVSLTEGDNPLHTAVSIALNNKDDNCVLMTKYLLDLYSADPLKYQYLEPNIQDEKGDTVMHKVFQSNNPKQYRKIMDLLSKFDTKLTINNNLGKDAKYKIKNTDPRFITWNEVRKKQKHNPQSCVSKSGKSNGNLAQVKIQVKSSLCTSGSGESSCQNSATNKQTVTSEKAELQVQLVENAKKATTPKEHLVQVIRHLILSLDLSKAQSLFDTLKQTTAEHATDLESTDVPIVVLSSSSEGEELNDSSSVDIADLVDVVNEFLVVDNNRDDRNGEPLEADVDLSNIDFNSMTWEIECSPEALRKLGSKAVPHYMKNKIIMSIESLGNGEWTRSLNKQLKLKSSIKLFEVKLDKGARMLWELAIDFSPRCSEEPDKILATELVSEKTGRVYTEIIRIWDIVLDHCKLNHAIENICSAYDRGLSCILRKKLKGTTKVQVSSNAQKRIPMYFMEDTETERNMEHAIPDYFPPASASETEYNIMKFHSFSTDMALNILSNMNARVEYPFRVGELEYAVIDLNPKPMEAIILIGRSGTGKTTCCLYRLWKKFHSYWEKAELIGSPWLVKQTWQRRYSENNEEEIVEDEENSEPELSDITGEEEPEEAVVDELRSDEDKNVNLEHYHPVFITKNYVLCQEVQRNFLELSKSTKATSHFKPIEPNVYKLQDIKDENFPLFLTSQQLLILLDASMSDPFFPRNEDGSLKKSIVGWSSMVDSDMLDLLRDDEDENEPDPEDEEEEKECDLTEPDPRVFVTFDLFAKKLWPKMKKGKSPYNAALVWKEIKSFLKGSFEALSCRHGRLTEEEYIKLGKKRAPNFQGDRKEIYQLFCLYEQIKNSEGYFDEEDVLYNLSCRLSRLEELPWSIHELYGDEIQDFTQAELFLLMRCINDPNSMFLTGDTAQSIMKGVSFRFSDLRSLFFYANKKCSNDKIKSIVRKPKQIYHLYQNYRSHSGILQLASGVVDLLQHFFPESFDRLPRDCGLFDGPKPTVLESCSVSDLAILLRGNKRKTQPIEFGAHQVILVTNEVSKENLPEELSLALVLTIYEAKGLEFDDVLLYNFFTDSEAFKEWRIISSFNPICFKSHENQPLIQVPLERASNPSIRPLTLDPEMHKMLNGELKQLYTAITRARVNLWIFDENQEKRAPAFDYFVKGDFVRVVQTEENKDFDDNMFVKTSTNKEWISRGDYYANHQCWKAAAKCYQKGGAVEKEKLAFAHGEVLGLQTKKASGREKLLSYLGLAKTYLECREPKLALKCLNKAKEFNLCAQLCEKMEKIKDAAFFYKKAEDNKLAAQLYEQAGEHEAALNLYYREKMFQEAIDAIERHQKNTGSPLLQFTEKKFYLEAAASFFRKNNLSKMSEVLSKLDIEDQLVFLKNRKCWPQAAELLKSNNRCEEAASLMREHGRLLEAANLTGKEEYRASCLLALARHMLANNEDPGEALYEARKLFLHANNKVEAAETLLLQGIFESNFQKIKRSFFEFWEKSHHAGVVESLFYALSCETSNSLLLHMTSSGLDFLVNLTKALKETRTNADREMVKSCLDFYGVVQLDEQQCSVLQHEGARFSSFQTKQDNKLWELKDVKLLLLNRLLEKLCDISEEVLAKNHSAICSSFIIGEECLTENCPDFHDFVQRFELKRILESKIDLITICGLLVGAQSISEEFSDNLQRIVEMHGFKSCKSLLSLIFPKHFHLRILSENPKICREILLRIEVPCRVMLKKFLQSLLTQSKLIRRESTDLWLQVMQIYSLLSHYPDGLQRRIAEEEEEYEKEYNWQTKKVKGLEGRLGMLKPDTSLALARETQVHFFRLFQTSVDELYINRNPDGCKRYFYRFMNLLVLKCAEPLIPNIGNTVMLLEFQFILCCAVLMRFSDCVVLLPKSYISIFNYWDYMFKKMGSLKDIYSILWEYSPKNLDQVTRHFQHHLFYLARVLCGEENKDFNVILDAFKCVDYISSGEAERTLVLCLVMMVNLAGVVSEKAKPILKQNIPQVQQNLKELQEKYPRGIPKRLMNAVDKMACTEKAEELQNLLQDLLANRDDERLVECFWKWDTMYGKGHVRGIYFNDKFKYRKYSPFRQNLPAVKPFYRDHEQEDTEEEKMDLLAAVAVQVQKQRAIQKLNMLFLFAYIYTKWKRTCKHVKESVPDSFKRANIDRTQCDLCGVKFSQGVRISDSSEIEEDLEDVASPTITNIEDLEMPAIQALSESYEDHVVLERHKQQNDAYKEYLCFFKHEVDSVITEGRSLAQNLEARTKPTSCEEFYLVQTKIENKMKQVADLMEEIYAEKIWSEAEELLMNPVNELKSSISEGHELLEKPEQQTTNAAGIADSYEFDFGDFTELWQKKSKRGKRKSKRH